VDPSAEGLQLVLLVFTTPIRYRKHHVSAMHFYLNIYYTYEKFLIFKFIRKQALKFSSLSFVPLKLIMLLSLDLDGPICSFCIHSTVYSVCSMFGNLYLVRHLSIYFLSIA
jgi:hypothetical protein